MHKTMLSKNSANNVISEPYGFTLLEVLVSISILLFAMLGLFQSVNLALDTNLENQLRQQAVTAAEKTISDQKKLKFENITASNSLSFEQITAGSVFRNMSMAHRIDSLAVDVANTNTKQISVRVWWRYKNKLYEHQTSSSVGKVNK